MTRFSPVAGGGREGNAGSWSDIALRNAGWGLLAAEVLDEADAVVVRLEAPGMDKDDFNIRVFDGRLVVRGEKKAGREHTRGRYYVTECAYGFFERSLPLPEVVETDRARAIYRNGVLVIELPKAASRRRRTVRVDVK
jgi:HSP20 family protein